MGHGADFTRIIPSLHTVKQTVLEVCFCSNASSHRGFSDGNRRLAGNVNLTYSVHYAILPGGHGPSNSSRLLRVELLVAIAAVGDAVA